MVRLKFLIICALLGLLSGCEQLPFWAKDEGVITYELTYPHHQNFPLINIMPSEMKFYFKGDMMKLESSSFAGIMKSTLIANTEDQSFEHLVSIMGDDMLLRVDKAGLPAFLEKTGSVSTAMTNQVDSVAHCPCTKGLMKFPGLIQKTAPFCVTSDIHIDSPNFFNQYHQIEGVLLEYEIEQMGMRVHLRAKEIVREEIPEATFQLKKSKTAKEVSYEDIKSRVGEILVLGQ